MAPRSSNLPLAGNGNVVLRAYANYTPATASQPDLTMSEAADWFKVTSRSDPNLSSQFAKNAYGHTAWIFNRLELYTGTGTLVLPTVAVTSEDSHNTLRAEKTLITWQITIWCHVSCLIGGQETQIGFKIGLCRIQKDSQPGTYSTFISELSVGSTSGFTSSNIDISLLEGILNGQQVPRDSASNRPIWKLPFNQKLSAGQTGPFLQRFTGFETIEADYSLDITSIRMKQAGQTDFWTLQFEFGSTAQAPECTFLGMMLPIDTSGIVIRQRVSDEWVAGKVGTCQWLLGIYSSLDLFWKSVRDRYRSALTTVRPTNRLTFLPSFGSSGGLNLKIECLATLISPVLEVSSGDLGVLLQRAYPETLTGDHVSSTATFEGIGSYPCVLSQPSVGIEAGSLGLELSFPPLQTDPARTDLPVSEPVRIGSLDLTFGGKFQIEPSRLSHLVLLDLSSHTNTVPRFGARLFLPVVTVDPAGQDGLPGSEYVPENSNVLGSDTQACVGEAAIEQEFQGSVPLVIAIGPVPGDGSIKGGGQTAPPLTYWAEITESNPRPYSQTVSINLHANDNPDKDPHGDEALPTQRVIVLGSDPFMVAEVRFKGLHQRIGNNASDVIAIWSMDRVDGAGWELYTNKDPFDLVLPPQSLGEEMPKGREFEAKYSPTPHNLLLPLDFRFSSPAVDTLEGSYTPQNYTEAPWNLRRILGYPGQRDAGAGVVQLQYELLYGLSCVDTAPMLRLAEIFSTLGRIPGSLQPLLTAVGSDPTSNSYLAYRKLWADYYALYSKRVAILEPRSSGANYGNHVGLLGASATPEVFTLEDGVQCTFRSKASLYYSASSEVDSQGTPVDQNDFNIDLTGLRGGATWGFEAPRIYHATLRKNNSTSATVVNPYFSALGGSGYQKVSFDKGLTSVYSNTEIGRTFYYSIERMGRIGIYHNLARHVIEYERSVAPGPQFAGSQTPFCGGPVLRKMREYVQILEPKVDLSAGKTTYPECGCANAIEFKTEIIPVDSSWGANVGSTGWKIPLWRRSASLTPAGQASAPAKKPQLDAGNSCLPPPYVYNKPEIVFDMAGVDGTDVECAITDPEKLYFYTETDESASADPHQWMLVEGLDFSLAPVPAQNPGFQSQSVNELPAYDGVVPAALSSFTLHLDPGHGAVNLVNGRTAQALGSVLKSVTFQRPHNLPTLPDVAIQISTATQKIRQDIFTAIRTSDPNLQSKVADLQQLLGDKSSTTSASLQGRLNSYITTQTNNLTGPANQLKSKIQSNFNQLSASINTEFDAFQQDWNAQCKRLGSGLSPQSYKLALKSLADNEVDSLFARIQALSVSANPLGRLCASIDNALTAASGRLSSVLATYNATLAQEAANANLDLNILNSQINQFSLDVHSALDQLRSAIQSNLESWMPGCGMVVHAWEGAICQFLSPMDALIGAANLKVSDVQALLKTPPAALEDFRGKLETAVNTALNGLNFTIAGLGTLVQASIEGIHQSVRSNVDALIDSASSAADIAQLQNKILLAVSNPITTALIAVPPAAGLLNTISSTENAVSDALKKLLNSTLTDASKEVAEALKNIIPGGLAKDLEAARKSAEDALGRYVDSLLTSLPLQIDVGALPKGSDVDAVLQRAFGAAPQVPNLNFSLPDVGYFYLPGVQTVNLTPLLTQVSGLGAALSPLGSMLPSTSILDRMVPSDLLKNFNISDVLPNFAGLQLGSLFSGLKMPDGADKYIKVSQGIDQSSRRAWVQADINFVTDTVATLFTVGPLALQLPKATFACQVKFQVDASGQLLKQATGSITGDWTLIISGTDLVTMTSTSLSFDEQGHVHFNVSPDRVVLAEALNFIEEIISTYSSPDSGFSIVPSPTGIETRLDLPIPNTAGGTSGITNLTLGFSFGLQFAPFAITAGFNLGREKAPFNIMVFILGGAGFVETDVTFVPGQQLQCSVTIELAASASLAIAFGPISGYVAIFLGMSVNFKSGAGSDLRLGIFIQVIGEVSILSIVSAYVGLRLEATYANGTFTGRGQFTISIKICWCFTLNVDEHVEFTLAGGGGGSKQQNQQVALNEPPPRLFALHEPLTDSMASILSALPTVDYAGLANAYISMIS